MALSLILFAVGFFILIKGADLLIDGASFVARKLHLSNWIVGTLIAGIGTSIPEFSITMVSVLSGESEVAIGNIVGSGMVNILLILGISSLATPLLMKDQWIKRDMVWNILSLTAVLAFAFLPIGGPAGQISAIEGIILLALFLIWIWRIIREKTSSEESDITEYSFTFLSAIVMIGAGFIGVIVGGNWVVSGAVALSKLFGVSEGLIALTIIGIGTSLPELAVSLVAAIKKQPGIAVGNIIGSTIFDFLAIVGMSAIVKPFFFPTTIFFDALLAILAAVLLLILMFFGRKKVLDRRKGALMVVAYMGYLFFLIFGK